MPEPMYRQIAENLRGKIEAGELPDNPTDPRLPTEIELMEEYNTSRNTVRDAIKLLTTRGLVETRPGQGTFVLEKINPFVTTLSTDPKSGRGGGEESVYIAEVAASGREPTFDEPIVRIERAEPSIADALRLEPGSQVISRYRARFIDGKPWSREKSFYSMKLVQNAHADRLLEAMDIGEGTVSYLGSCGIEQAGYRDSIAVRAPDEGEITFFRLPTDGRVSVFEIYRVAFDGNGDRIRLTITVYPADRNRFINYFGKVPRQGELLR
jgi:GntR family transcriptional regulator